MDKKTGLTGYTTNDSLEQILSKFVILRQEIIKSAAEQYVSMLIHQATVNYDRSEVDFSICLQVINNHLLDVNPDSLPEDKEIDYKMRADISIGIDENLIFLYTNNKAFKELFDVLGYEKNIELNIPIEEAAIKSGDQLIFNFHDNKIPYINRIDVDQLAQHVPSDEYRKKQILISHELDKQRDEYQSKSPNSTHDIEIVFDFSDEFVDDLFEKNKDQVTLKEIDHQIVFMEG